MTDFKNVYDLYTACQQKRDRAKPLWEKITAVTGINVDPEYAYTDTEKEGQALDGCIDDPTSAISVTQAGDYLVGIMWGTGEKVLDLVPSRYVKELLGDEQEVKDFYAFASDQLLYHMNHHEAGYAASLQPYAYEQFSHGTSGIGIFPNGDFINRTAENALNCQNYGVDNTCIDEGKSGRVDIVFATYRWKLNRIIGEFCTTGGVFDQAKLSKLPQAIQKAYTGKDYTTSFTLVFGMFPRSDFNPKLKGKKGTRYRGVWFLDDRSDNKIFKEEDFSERPVNMARMIRIRGQVWGRSPGTMLISTIRSVNFMVGSTIDILEKMGEPALGMFNNAIMGDNVLDTSASGLTVFNQMFSNGQNPLFPLYDVGDPSGIIKFLIPYLNEKVTTAFKIDQLLDFNTQGKMTATESLQRYTIRGQSLAPMLVQQKNERLTPDVKRACSILMGMGELGIDPRKAQAAAASLRKRGKPERVIPMAVLEVMEQGRPWYEIRWNNELERLIRTQAVQNLLQILNTIIAIAGVFPQIIEAVKWYELLKAINDNLDANNKILLTAAEFKKLIEAMAKEQQAAKMLAAGQAGAAINKDAASANKMNQEATGGR